MKEILTENILILHINVLFLFSSMQQNQTSLLFLTNYLNNVVLQTGFFFLKMQWRWYHPDHVHTMYTIQHCLHAMYFRCYNNYMIEENDNFLMTVLFSLT